MGILCSLSKVTQLISAEPGYKTQTPWYQSPFLNLDGLSVPLSEHLSELPTGRSSPDWIQGLLAGRYQLLSHAQLCSGTEEEDSVFG